MRPRIISDGLGGSQASMAGSACTDVSAGSCSTTPAFDVLSILPELSRSGFSLLPGLTGWFDSLSPLNHVEAWEALADKHLLEMIRTHPEQQKRFFLNDSMELDRAPQLSVDFERKQEKSHLTILEGIDSFALCRRLPNSVRVLLERGSEFLRNVRELFSDVLPTPTLPTVLKMRIFRYHASDPLAGLKLNRPVGMRSHVDGSICTLIIAESDGLLRLEHQGNWISAIRPDKGKFALIIPGVVAASEYGVKPTPHMVLAGPEDRISVTVFFTPALSGNLELAEQQIAKWNLKRSLQDEDSFAE